MRNKGCVSLMIATLQTRPEGVVLCVQFPAIAWVKDFPYIARVIMRHQVGEIVASKCRERVVRLALGAKILAPIRACSTT